MGGRALKNVETVRIDKPTFDKMSIKLIQDLLNCQSRVGYIPLSYLNKDSFGDIDVLIKYDDEHFDIKKYIEVKYKPTEIYHNGDIYSFDYKNVQIDFIKIKPEDWECAKVYFSFNDLGNLMGRIAASLGFSYGFEGLCYKYYYKNQKKSILLSKDPAEIFNFIGFEYFRYRVGFEMLEDVFDYVTDSYYFNARVFDYDMLNHQNRTRNKKRKTYAQFLEHLKLNQSVLTNYKRLPKFFYQLKASYFFRSNVNFFTEKRFFRAMVNNIIKSKKKFNGDILMKKYPEFSEDRKLLGKVIVGFKEYIEKCTDIDFSVYLQCIAKKEILKLFDMYYKLYKFNNTQDNSKYE